MKTKYNTYHFTMINDHTKEKLTLCPGHVFDYNKKLHQELKKLIKKHNERTNND